VGVVQKQTINNTFIIYIGVALGFITSGLIFPAILKTDQIGLLGVLTSYSILFAHFSSLGLRAMIIKIFPVFKTDDKKHNGFLSLVNIIALIGYLLALIIFLIFRDDLIENKHDTSPIFADYINLLIPLIFFTLYFNILDSFNIAIYETMIGIIAKELVQRIVILLSLAMFFFEIIDFKYFVYFYVGAHFIPLLISIWYIYSKGQWNFIISKKFLNRKLSSHMFSVAIFGLISSSSGIVISNLDRILIERYLGLSLTGIYITTFYFATLVIMPSRAMLRITGPIISEELAKNNIIKVKEILYKSSITLWTVGIAIFLVIWINIENIFRILPDNYILGKYVIFFIGMANLADLLTGAASNIIGNSKYYRFATYLQATLISLVLLLNIVLIPIFGIVGAAIAALLSKVIVNLLRFIIVKWKFNLNPYKTEFIYVLIIGVLSYFSICYIPFIFNIYLDVFIRTLLSTLIYTLLIYFIQPSQEINDQINIIISKLSSGKKTSRTN